MRRACLQAHRRVAGATLSARAMSRLALGDVAGFRGRRAACDLLELALAAAWGGHEACGQGRRALVPGAPRRHLHRHLQAAGEAAPAPAAATPAADGAATLRLRAHAGAGPSSAVGTFDVSLDAVDAAWEATGLKHIKASEWYDLRRKACPHGVTLSPADEVAGCALFDASLFSATSETRETRETKKSNRAALKNLRDIAAHAVPSEKYAEKELFAERAMSLYAKKRASVARSSGEQRLDLAFEAVNIDALEPGEQLRICVLGKSSRGARTSPARTSCTASRWRLTTPKRRGARRRVAPGAGQLRALRPRLGQPRTPPSTPGVPARPGRSGASGSAAWGR